jgi:hypothetical protein
MIHFLCCVVLLDWEVTHCDFRIKERVVIFQTMLHFEFRRSLIFQKPVATIRATCFNIKKIVIFPMYNVDRSFRFHRTNSNHYQNLHYKVEFMMEAQIYLRNSSPNGGKQELQYTIWLSSKENSVPFLHIECKCFEKYQINSDYLTSCLYSDYGLCQVETEIYYECIM